MQNLEQTTQNTRIKLLKSSVFARIFAFFAISASVSYAVYNYQQIKHQAVKKTPTPVVLEEEQKTHLTVVSIDDSSTVFNEGNIKHGFGYDLVRLYANDQLVELDFQVVEDNATAIALLQQGKADIAMTTAELETLEEEKLTAFTVACGDTESFEKHGLDTKLNWAFDSKKASLMTSAQDFVCEHEENGTLQQLASFYSHYILPDETAWFLVKRDLASRLPTYRKAFQKSAKEYNLDWHLLAAIGYQESLLKADSTSPTGVKGLMMLTNSTAKELGVENREDPFQSIQGGAKYYQKMLRIYKDVPEPDRTWFALVAYNMGPAHVRRIQYELVAQGKDPTEWVNLYDYLQRNQAENSRYTQAIHYVTRIRAFLEYIKTSKKSSA